MAEAVEGLGRVTTRLKNLPMKSKVEAAQALYFVMRQEQAEADRKCPKDTGNLVGTGVTHLPTIGAKDVQCIISYGGKTARSPEGAYYAIFVHEDLEANHPNGGEAKWLESTINEGRPHYPKRVAARMELARMV